MRFSVVTPTYNRRDSLRVTIVGLMRQDFPMSNFELVVVSDGSNDGTHEMLAEIAPTMPFALRWFAQQNQGPSVARNRGIQEAEGDIVVFLDDDVEPLPQFLAAHAKHHEGDSHVAVVGPMSPDPARAKQEPVWIAWEHAKLQEIYDFFRPTGAYPQGNGGPMHFYSGNASVRREWLVAVGGFDVAYTRQEDVELATRLERDCGVRFQIDLSADGLHRPTRTWESWYRIPVAYGTLDAQRLREGTLDWARVKQLAAERNPLTRTVSDFCVAAPPLAPATFAALKASALGLHAARMTGPALAVLSALYNATYSHAMATALSASGWKPSAAVA